MASLWHLIVNYIAIELIMMIFRGLLVIAFCDIELIQVVLHFESQLYELGL